MYILDYRYCHVYVCGDGITVTNNSATVHFISDDPHAKFHCRYNQMWYHPCEYTT